MSEAARLSKLLFEAREIVDMYDALVQARAGAPDEWTTRVRDEIDAYRAERGWSAHGFGHEEDDAR